MREAGEFRTTAVREVGCSLRGNTWYAADRRAVLRATGAAAVVGTVECVTDSSNFTGRGQVEVKAGVPANGGHLGFDPPAIKVSLSTVVRWVWTGKGGSHDVVGN